MTFVKSVLLKILIRSFRYLNSWINISRNDTGDIGGSKRGARDARPLLGVQILSFSCSFWQKIDKIIDFWELAPPPGENPGSATGWFTWQSVLTFSSIKAIHNWTEIYVRLKIQHFLGFKHDTGGLTVWHFVKSCVTNIIYGVLVGI